MERTPNEETLHAVRREMRQIRTILVSLVLIMFFGILGAYLFVRPYMERLDAAIAVVEDIRPSMDRLNELSAAAEELQPQLKSLADLSVKADEFKTQLDSLNRLSANLNALQDTVDTIKGFIPGF